MALDELVPEIEARRERAFLVTVGDDGAPHVTSTLVSWRADALEASAGRTTRANASARPTVTVIWPGAPGEPYSLLVDGDAAPGSEAVVVHPTRAVLHRVAGAPGDGPSCVRLEASGPA